MLNQGFLQSKKLRDELRQLMETKLTKLYQSQAASYSILEVQEEKKPQQLPRRQEGLFGEAQIELRLGDNPTRLLLQGGELQGLMRGALGDLSTIRLEMERIFNESFGHENFGHQERDVGGYQRLMPPRAPDRA